MNCEELAQLIPDLVDGTLPDALLAEAQAALPQCPDCQRDLEIARQVHAFMVAFQAQHADLHVPAGFETRLLAHIHSQHSGLELLDLSSKALGMWLIELINLLGGLIDPASAQRASGVQTAGA